MATYRNYDYLVDTNPMASSIDTVSGHVNATTAAVAAMESAVILTEQESAETICNNIDRGFYCLIQSQISTKKAKAISELRAKFIELQQMAKALADKHARMESDVARLKVQYGRTFHSIDKALEHRIAELDKEAFELSVVRKKLITGRPLKCIPEVIFADRESGNVEQMTYTARLKSRTSRALRTIGSNIAESEEYKDQLTNVLSDASENGSFREYVPVMLVGEKSISVKDVDVLDVVAPEGLPERVKNAVQSAVREDEESIKIELPTDQDQTEIRKEFQKIASEADLESRVYDALMDLFINGGH